MVVVGRRYGRKFARLGSQTNVHVYPAVERSFRTVVALAILAVFNAFDLAFTQVQMARGNFAEANFLAAAVAQLPAGMALYKLALFGLGSFILYRYRAHWASEVGVWGLTVCYAGLMLWWTAYLDALEICLSDTAVVCVALPL